MQNCSFETSRFLVFTMKQNGINFQDRNKVSNLSDHLKENFINIFRWCVFIWWAFCWKYKTYFILWGPLTSLNVIVSVTMPKSIDCKSILSRGMHELQDRCNPPGVNIDDKAPETVSGWSWRVQNNQGCLYWVFVS